MKNREKHLTSSALHEKLKKVDRLIDRPCPSSCAGLAHCPHEGQKDAARNVLGRILMRMAERGDKAANGAGQKALKEINSEYGWPDHTEGYVYGPRYEAMLNKSLKEKAAQIKRDIQLARKLARKNTLGEMIRTGSGIERWARDPIGEMPECIKVGVTSDYLSNGVSVIDITLRDVPEGWGWTTTERPVPGTSRTMTYRRTSDRLRELADELMRCHWAYNAYKGNDQVNDFMVDPDQCSYHGGVDVISSEGWTTTLA